MKDQPFYIIFRNPDAPHTRVHVDLTAGSFSQIQDHVALNGKNAAAVSNAISLARYSFNRPEISDETRAALHQLKLDLVTSLNFSWRVVHNMLMWPSG